MVYQNERVTSIRVGTYDLAAVVIDSGRLKVVIFCHGYRSSSIGPARAFVTVARRLADLGISSVRFDQYGSGNSPGDFYESSFAQWIDMIVNIATRYQLDGYQVMLFGQSMGASAAIAASARLDGLVGVVAWVPDASIDKPVTENPEYIEEAGERVRLEYWLEANAANVPGALERSSCPMLIFQSELDEYVDHENKEAIIVHAQISHRINLLKGHKHSSWNYEQLSGVINHSIDFIEEQFTHI